MNASELAAAGENFCVHLDLLDLLKVCSQREVEVESSLAHSLDFAFQNLWRRKLIQAWNLDCELA